VSDSLFHDVNAHVVDTNLFVAFERHDTVGCSSESSEPTISFSSCHHACIRN